MLGTHHKMIHHDVNAAVRPIDRDNHISRYRQLWYLYIDG